ncbi:MULTISPECIES: class I SAM-dependent methyltransferase [unclassified Neptuniibacter]|uniref:class I SAM-dependent methyltransferase n=1 Tax=unclassified Neptuniibacter TaxID=2630693 RepID=UPI0025F01578|nr:MULTISPECIES: class I SAM-dependent methyltransferase [unclassified Neptuniibacter]
MSKPISKPVSKPMSEPMTESVEQHYEQALDAKLIIESLQKAYPQGPDIYQLAPIDQLHIGGIKASLKLLDRIQHLNASRILDIGSGLGGLMRLLQSNLTGPKHSQPLNIIGVDICHPFNQINRKISSICKQKPPSLITADAHHLPFMESQFDLIIFQHSLLNIPDDSGVLKECWRLLKPSGHILLHEVIEGTQPEMMLYPVPWARDAQHSHLINEQHLRDLLKQSRFQLSSFDNWSAQALEWRTRQSVKEQTTSQNTPPVSPAMILGPEFKLMGHNLMKNLQNNAAEVVEVLAKKAS